MPMSIHNFKRKHRSAIVTDSIRQIIVHAIQNKENKEQIENNANDEREEALEERWPSKGERTFQWKKCLKKKGKKQLACFIKGEQCNKAAEGQGRQRKLVGDKKLESQAQAISEMDLNAKPRCIILLCIIGNY